MAFFSQNMMVIFSAQQTLYIILQPNKQNLISGNKKGLILETRYHIIIWFVVKSSMFFSEKRRPIFTGTAFHKHLIQILFRRCLMLECLIVGAGGAVGAILRHLVGMVPLTPENGFPVKTFLINVIGSFIIGLVAALTAKYTLNPRLVLFLKVGICGGFTTFSSFALETDQLLAKGAATTAAPYVLLSIICGILAVFAAQKLVI